LYLAKKDFMIENSKINEVVNKIASNFNPEKIFLFGSYASGSPDYDSDLDLLIIQHSELPRHRRVFEIRKSLIGIRIPIDIIVYTPEEFEIEKEVKFSFINNAIKESKLLYERI
jgi:predicted nucleotidyltransferase